VFTASIIVFLVVVLPIVSIWLGVDSRTPGARQW
jgi:hypothetical protein